VAASASAAPSAWERYSAACRAEDLAGAVAALETLDWPSLRGDRRLLRLLDTALAVPESEAGLVGALYERLAGLGLVPSFGVAPAPRVGAVDARELERRTGLGARQFSPTSSARFLAGGALACAGILALAASLGVDPNPAAAALALAALADQVALGGALGDRALRLLVPSYAERVCVHEAGHLVAAYLLGCPVRGVVLSPAEAMRRRIPGQAGTIFFDEDLDRGARGQGFTAASVDRWSVVVMAGIAAEALRYGQAEGGRADEAALASVVAALAPPWTEAQLRNQARWAAAEAVALLVDHRDAHDAVVRALLDAGGGVPRLSDVIAALEDARPHQSSSSSPSDG